MKRKHNKRKSDDDMDNLPLKYICHDDKTRRSIEELRRHSVHECEFCDERFENRYDYLIHNAKHIIIPLIKLLPHYCAECSLYCISEDEMKEHISVKHKSLVKPKTNDDISKVKLAKCKFKNNDTKEESEDEKPLNYFIKKEKNKDAVENRTDMLQNFVMNCKVDVEKFIPPWLSSHKQHKNNHEIDIHETLYENNEEFKLITEINSIIKREAHSKNNMLEFKDSVDKNIINKNYEGDIKAAAIGIESTLEFSDMDDDPIIILTPVKQEFETEYSSEHDSIHFDDLIKPGIFYCKRCLKRFPNRYEVIVHETLHLDLSKAAPKNFKVKHKRLSKFSMPLSMRKVSKHNKKCGRCEERTYNKTSHAQTCLKYHCAGCGQGFRSKTILMIHEKKCNKEVKVNMCDTCLYMGEKPKHVQYSGIVRSAKLEVKRMCDWCKKQCDMLSLVTIISKQRLADRIRFEGDSTEVDKFPKLPTLKKTREKIKRRASKKHDRRAARGSKIRSNWERLKLIQNRLKSMKK